MPNYYENFDSDNYWYWVNSYNELQNTNNYLYSDYSNTPYSTSVTYPAYTMSSSNWKIKYTEEVSRTEEEALEKLSKFWSLANKENDFTFKVSFDSFLAPLKNKKFFREKSRLEIE